MTIYRLHISLKDDPEMIRIIDVPGTFSLIELHLTILSALELGTDQLASFYTTDESWKKGREITLVDMKDESGVPTMEGLCVRDSMNKTGDRLVYVYDYVMLWTFYIRLLDPDVPIQEGMEYPLLIEEQGDFIPGGTEGFDAASPGEDEALKRWLKQEGLDLFGDEGLEDGEDD